MHSKAQTVTQYIKELPAEKREVVSAVRKAILKSLPKGYEETMLYGMISYVIPLKTYPKGYLNDPNVPLGIAALASQKNYYAVYLAVYMDHDDYKEFQRRYKSDGKKLDMGKSCVRFRKLEDLSLDALAWAISRTTPGQYIKIYEKSRTK